MTSSTSVCEKPSLTVSKTIAAAVASAACQSQGEDDGRLAFVLPFSTITLLAASANTTNGFIVDGIIPALIAGGSGYLLYRSSKILLRFVRQNQLLSGTQPKALQAGEAQ